MYTKKPPSDLNKNCAKDWKTLINNYEAKQYDKAVKVAESILKKSPNHVDTICIKALSLIQDKEPKAKEAIELIKNTLKTNLKNPKCWRCLGQLHTYDGQYEQAMNAYKTSLKMDPKGVEVMRELSELQIYSRDLQGYHENRTNIFMENSSVVGNWMAYATSAYLTGDVELALKIITTYIDNNLHTNKSNKISAKSRPICFKLKLLEETGKYQEALNFLKKYEMFLLDKTYLNEFLFRIYTKLGQKEKAKEAITFLFERNTEKHDYHIQYLTCNNLLTQEGVALEENIPKILELYKELKKKHPRSFLISRIPLTYAKGDQFKQLFSEFLKPNLVKGVPSLFNSVKVLYRDQDKVNLITQVVTEILESVQNNNCFPGDEEKLPITTILWVWIFVARHHDILKEHTKAFHFIDKAIEHTPTLEDLYFIKAKFAKHVGDFITAHRLVDKAKSIDIGDRFMNTKATIYAFRCGKNEVAELTASHFAKEQGQINLNHMQAHWFFKEAGLCFYNKKEYTKALEMFKIAMKHYTEYRNDEYDFHGFNHRHSSLTSEVEMVKSTDKYFRHPDYFVSATKALEIYLLLSEKKTQETQIEKSDKVTPNEDYFAEAVKLSQTLEKNNPHRIETHLLAFQVNMRRKKFLLALKSLKQAHSFSPEDSRVHLAKVQYFSQVYSNNLNEVLVKVIKKEQEEKSGLGGVSLQQYVDNLPSKTTSERLCVARSLFTLDKSAHLERISKLFSTDETPSGLLTCVEAYEFLVELGLKDSAQTFRTFCTNSFPFSNYFGNQKIATVQEDFHDKAYEESDRPREVKPEVVEDQPPKEEKQEEQPPPLIDVQKN